MTAILKDHRLFYASMPKVACTSLKRMFFEIENARPFEPAYSNGRMWHVHFFYPGLLRKDYPEARIADFRRLTVVRDPVRRLLSAYSNRVVHHRAITPQAARRAGRIRRLTPHPDLDEFIDRFEHYLAIPDMLNHCRPMVDWIGSDPGYFHAVYDISRIDAFLEDVSNTIGHKVEAGRFQTGGPKIAPSELTARQRAKLVRYYRKDYEAFGSFFQSA
jgi:hypothetical protein